MISRAAIEVTHTNTDPRRGITDCTATSHAAIARSCTRCSDAAWEHLSQNSPFAISDVMPTKRPRTGKHYSAAPQDFDTPQVHGD